MDLLIDRPHARILFAYLVPNYSLPQDLAIGRKVEFSRLNRGHKHLARVNQTAPNCEIVLFAVHILCGFSLSNAFPTLSRDFSSKYKYFLFLHYIPKKLVLFFCLVTFFLPTVVFKSLAGPRTGFFKDVYPARNNGFWCGRVRFLCNFSK